MGARPAAYGTIIDFMMASQNQIPISLDGKPCPFHYAAFFSSLLNYENKYWSSFLNFKELLPGDLIVYLPNNYEPKEISELPKGRTGMHIMVVEQVLQINEDQIELMIIDCTRFRHCQEDSREKGGIGRAPLSLQIHPDETLLQWGSRKKTWSKDLFFGRLI